MPIPLLAGLAAKFIIPPAVKALPWRAIGIGFGALVIIGGLWWGVHSIHHSGVVEGRGEVQAKWDADVREQAKQAQARALVAQQTMDISGVQFQSDIATFQQQAAAPAKRIEHDVQVVAVYADPNCRLTDGVWRSLNELRALTVLPGDGRGDRGSVPRAGGNP